MMFLSSTAEALIYTITPSALENMRKPSSFMTLSNSYEVFIDLQTCSEREKENLFEDLEITCDEIVKVIELVGFILVTPSKSINERALSIKGGLLRVVEAPIILNSTVEKFKDTFCGLAFKSSHNPNSTFVEFSQFEVDEIVDEDDEVIEILSTLNLDTNGSEAETLISSEFSFITTDGAFFSRATNRLSSEFLNNLRLLNVTNEEDALQLEELYQ